MTIRWTEKAFLRLEQISLHIEQDSPEAAQRTVAQIYERIEEFGSLNKERLEPPSLHRYFLCFGKECRAPFRKAFNDRASDVPRIQRYPTSGM